ncbi:hypothetical protein HXX76_011836 [Chlamydomonas incerta]|uniref:SnoaL-like domain-containing protein n=1 Tax=Chlamydomonas incerta TaxID=51695 RepID=A0A835VWX9_CHLIN|nr:hypothetical protein HXX76_011836 [Chlamydomonas incerta]|eukprot:KAG2428156.1 hypothetical protein HXX76_011836 [Chlamydomonas incerta]
MSVLAAPCHGRVAQVQASAAPRVSAPRSRRMRVVAAAQPEPMPRRDMLKAAFIGGLASSALGGVPQQAAAAAGPAATLGDAYAAYGAFAAGGDYSRLDAYFTNDTTWLSNVNGGFKGKGKADIQRFFAWNLATNDVSSFKPLQFIEQGNKVSALVAMAGTGKKTGKRYDTVLAHFATVEGGKITEFREFTTADWSEAVGDTPFPK